MNALDVLRYAIAPLLAAVVGGLIVHRAARRRDIDNDRRRQRVDYLVTAYRTMARSAQRNLRGDRGEAFEDALADVVMFGTPEQIALATQIMRDLAARKDASVDRLLLSLRLELRTQLGLAADALSAVPTVRLSWGSELATSPLRLDDAFEVVFEDQLAITRDVLGAVPEALVVVEGSPDAEIQALQDLAETAPGAAVASAYALITRKIGDAVGEPAGTDAVELARLGAQHGIIRHETVRSVDGLRLLMVLSRNNGAGTGLSVERAHAYVDLVAATIYSIGPV